MSVVVSIFVWHMFDKLLT